MTICAFWKALWVKITNTFGFLSSGNLKENQPAHTGSLQPSSCPFKAKAQGGLGKINAEGLERVGDSYVKGAYGESDVTLNVDVQGGVGEINLEVV